MTQSPTQPSTASGSAGTPADGSRRAGRVDGGRVQQKLRTREALVAAANELLAEGGRPTLAQVGERARVSKATAYRYFASADDLIAEAIFERGFPRTEIVLPAGGSEPDARVQAVEAAVNDALLANETAMRMILRNAIDRSLASPGGEQHRVGRRMPLIAAAIAPLAERLDPARLDRLRCALALVIGPEAMLAARDVCGLDPSQTRALTGWAAQALLAQALAEAPPSPRPGGRARRR